VQKVDNTDMTYELVDNAPLKEELDTHDGLIYLPKQLMPAPMDDAPLLAAKSLNLRLKFVAPKKPHPMVSRKLSISEYKQLNGGFKNLHMGSMSQRNQVFPLTTSLVEIPELKEDPATVALG
jgi:hypothetical protein